MAEIRSHKELIVWQKGMDLAVQVYALAERLPGRDTYGLVSQVTRAAVSVPANIAEGKARGSTKDYCRFLAIARDSLAEVETYLLLAVRLNYINVEQAHPSLSLVDEIGRMLNALRSKLEPNP